MKKIYTSFLLRSFRKGVVALSLWQFQENKSSSLNRIRPLDTGNRISWKAAKKINAKDMFYPKCYGSPVDRKSE